MRDRFYSYYAISKDITEYMTFKLGVVDHDVVLELSAWEGSFVDEVLATGKKVRIDALDIDADAVAVLKKKYEENPGVVVRETDALLDAELDLIASVGGRYAKIIGNPPYEAWQDYEKRELLKKRFAGHYVKETYSLFLLRRLSLLRTRDRLSFIIPDTYLFLNMCARLGNSSLLARRSTKF